MYVKLFLRVFSNFHLSELNFNCHYGSKFQFLWKSYKISAILTNLNNVMLLVNITTILFILFSISIVSISNKHIPHTKLWGIQLVTFLSCWKLMILHFIFFHLILFSIFYILFSISKCVYNASQYFTFHDMTRKF